MTRHADDRLRILHLASHGSLQRGGAVQMIRLARGLAQRGHAVTAVFNSPDAAATDEPQARLAVEAGVRVEAIDLDADDAAARVCELWREGAFDVLHVHREQALLLAARALRGERIRCFVAQRGTVYLPDWFSEEHRLLVGRRVDRIVAVAHAVKRALAWRRLVPPWKIEVIYGGVDMELFHPEVDGAALREDAGIAPDQKLVTLPGALVEKKGTRFFLEAAARLVRERDDLHFWIVGRGSREAALRELCAKLGIAGHVAFLGQRSDMPAIYAASNLVVCASIKGEGLTGTLREALAMARPVVTTDVAGNTELVEEGQTGYVARPGDAASLAEAIARALSDEAEARRRADAGRRRVLDWCTEEVRSARVEGLYRRVMEFSHR